MKSTAVVTEILTDYSGLPKGPSTGHSIPREQALFAYKVRDAESINHPKQNNRKCPYPAFKGIQIAVALNFRTTPTSTSWVSRGLMTLTAALAAELQRTSEWNSGTAMGAPPWSEFVLRGQQ